MFDTEYLHEFEAIFANALIGYSLAKIEGKNLVTLSLFKEYIPVQRLPL